MSLHRSLDRQHQTVFDFKFDGAVATVLPDDPHPVQDLGDEAEVVDGQLLNGSEHLDSGERDGPRLKLMGDLLYLVLLSALVQFH